MSHLRRLPLKRRGRKSFHRRRGRFSIPLLLPDCGRLEIKMNIIKKTCVLLVLVLAVSLLFTGCGKTEQITPATPEPEPTTQIHTEESLTAVLSAAELKELDSTYPNLKFLDLSGSDCYDAILEYIASHPNVQVTYTVSISGGTEPVVIANTADTVTLSDSSYLEELAAKAAWLPALKTIMVEDPNASIDLIQFLKEAYPEASVGYSVQLPGQTVSSGTTSLDLSGLSADQVDEAAAALVNLPELETIKLSDTMAISDVVKLAQACPGAAFDYNFELFGQRVSASAERLEYVEEEIGNEGVEQIREVLPFMTKLSYLKLDKCGVSNEVMAQLRDDYPDIKVVWRVYFSGDGYNCLTDTEKIWATGTVTDGYTEPLKYCTDVKYMDLGHNCITHIDFINYMPKLEVAVLSISWIEDLSPLGNCPNLEFLEMYSSNISDVSALANCKNLKHLNLGNDYEVTDISALYDLDLERFYFNNNNVPDAQEEEFQRRHPDCECSFGAGHPVHTTWRFLPGYVWKEDLSETHYNERYALLREQIGYDTFDYSR